MPAKQRKYYPIDSFIATVWALIGKRVLRNYAQDLPQLQLAETSFFVQTLRSENQPDVGYLYRSKSKGEVDFYFDNCAFELKSKGSPSNAQREILLDCDQAFVLKENQVPIMAFLIGENESAKLSSI